MKLELFGIFTVAALVTVQTIYQDKAVESSVIRPSIPQIDTHQPKQQIPPSDRPTETIDSPDEPFSRTKRQLAGLEIDRRKSEAEYFVETAKNEPNFRETIRLKYSVKGQSGETIASLQGLPQGNGSVAYRFTFLPIGGSEIEGTLTGNHLSLKEGGGNVLFDGTSENLIDGIQNDVQDEFIGVIRFESQGVLIEWRVD